MSSSSGTSSRVVAATRSACVPSVELPRDLRVRAAVIISQGGDKVVGPRFVRLLHEIDAHGSIRQAALAIGLGYRHAIEWVQRAEAALGRPLVDRHPGRGLLAGARLTAEGRQLAEVYDQVERDIAARLASVERELGLTSGERPSTRRRTNP